MSSEKALETLAGFQDRLSKLQSVQSSSNWKAAWDFLRNDIDEWVKSTFNKSSKDYQKIYRGLYPRAVIRGVFHDPYPHFLGQAERLQQSLTLVKHRLTEGQAQPLQKTVDEHLIEPGTPHSAYVALREIIQTASAAALIVDPYVDGSIFQLLSNVSASVKVRILTRKQNLPSDFAQELRLFVQEKGVSVEARVGLTDFHDRFLIVDDRLFTSGASFKDLGKKGSVITEITEIKDQAVPLLEDRWTAATPLA